MHSGWGSKPGLHTCHHHDARTVIPHHVGYHPITSQGAGKLPFPSPKQHLMGAFPRRAKREWRPCEKQALGRQDPAGKVWLSVEEAINLWKLENSSKEETLEHAAPPLLCQQAAWGTISRVSPILGSTSDAMGILYCGLGAPLGSLWIFEGAGKMEEVLFSSRGCFLLGFGGVCLWDFIFSFNLNKGIQKCR